MSEDAVATEGMTFLEHLGELRLRLIWTLVALVVAFLACYPFSDRIFDFLQRPIRKVDPDAVLGYIRLTEPFTVHLKVAALAALLVAAPFVLLQFWLFVAPGLYRNEKRYAIPFVVVSSACFFLGAAFAFELLCPTAFAFFLEQGANYHMTVTLDQYFSLLFWLILGVALTFELPVVVALLARLGVVDSRFLIRNFHIAIVLCLIVAALITPTPDAMTMSFVAVPMMLLYGVGILVARVVEPKPDDD